MRSRGQKQALLKPKQQVVLEALFVSYHATVMSETGAMCINSDIQCPERIISGFSVYYFDLFILTSEGITPFQVLFIFNFVLLFCAI